MNKGKLLTLLGSFCSVLILAALPLVTACAQPAPAPAPTTKPTPSPPPAPAPAPAPTPAPAPAPAPVPAPTPAPKPKAVTLNLVAFLATFMSAVKAGPMFSEMVNERSKGELIVKVVGGPEVIPARNLSEAVKTGAIDIAVIPCTFLEATVPEAFNMTLTEYTPWEERESGFYDYMVKVVKEKMGTYYLGRGQYGNPFYTFINTSITKPKEMAGRKMAITGNLGKPFLADLGTVPIFIPTAELYTAMERRVVDGYLNTIDAVADVSLHEVTKYFIDHPYGTGTIMLLMNLDKWNSLTSSQQKLIMEVMTELEKKVAVFFKEITDKGRQKCLDKGMKAITFSPEDTKWYIDQFHSSHWEYLKKMVSPEAYAKLRQLMVKKT